MAAISLCMIVKNEEAVLKRCLDSYLGLFDEIIIVDTGSTDKTKEIARHYTEHLYDFPWIDDFSEARNFSVSKATCEYVMIADADEVLTEENRKRFALLKQILDPEIEIVEFAYMERGIKSATFNFHMEFLPRLYKRLRPLRFTDPIHETARLDPVVFRSDITIQHMPAASHAGRDIGQFQRLIERGLVLSDRLERMYARELIKAGEENDFHLARHYFENILSDPSCAHNAKRRTACVLARYYSVVKNAEMLLRVCAPELCGIPPAEICCALADYYHAQTDYKLAIEWYEAACSGAEAELAAEYAGAYPFTQLAACYEKLGDAVLSREYLTKAADWKPEALLNSYEEDLRHLSF